MNYKTYLADPDRGCGIIVHRGLWRDAPENSLMAVEAAIAEGFDIVEVDVRKSADGAFFLLHDDSLERMTGLDQPLESLTRTELSRLRLRNRDGGAANGSTPETLPSLEALFALTRGRIFIHLDVKDPALIPEVIALAKAEGVLNEVDVWHPLRHASDLGFITTSLLSQDIALVAKTRINVPDAQLQTELVLTLEPPVCEIYFDALSDLAPLRHRFEAAGIALWVNTLDDVSSAGLTDKAALENPEAVWGALLDAGISLIQTDEAAALRAFLLHRQKRTEP